MWRRRIGAEPAQAPQRRTHPWMRTVGLYAVTLFVVVTIVFILPRAMPGDPIQQRQDPNSSLYVSDGAQRARLLAYYGLDKPIPVQYANYLVRLAHGDLGMSIAQNVPVSSLILNRLPWTFLLMGTAIGVASLVSFVAGVGAAWRRGRGTDRIAVVLMTAFRSIPEYALAALLLITFAVVLPVFPLYGSSTAFATYSSPFARAGDVAFHLVLPAGALALGLLGAKFLVVRNSMVSVLGQDYMLLARAKGLPARKLKYHHAGRNALLPFLTVLGIQMGFAVGGAIFVESVFAYPGMGSLILSSVTARDYPVLEGCFLTLACAVLLVNLVIELVYQRLDPRVRAA